LLIRQPKKIAHNQGSSRSLNQITPSRSMGPDTSAQRIEGFVPNASI
jgi:hypothetical protein